MKFRKFLSRTFAAKQAITVRQDNEITCILASIYKIHNNTVSNFTFSKTELLEACAPFHLILEKIVIVAKMQW